VKLKEEKTEIKKATYMSGVLGIARKIH